jgi:hypothetical protein
VLITVNAEDQHPYVTTVLRCRRLRRLQWRLHRQPEAMPRRGRSDHTLLWPRGAAESAPTGQTVSEGLNRRLSRQSEGKMQGFESEVRRRDSLPPTHPPTTRSTPFHITQSFSSLGQRPWRWSGVAAWAKKQVEIAVSTVPQCDNALDPLPMLR